MTPRVDIHLGAKPLPEPMLILSSEVLRHSSERKRVPKLLFSAMNLKVILLKLRKHLPGDTELISVYTNECFPDASKDIVKYTCGLPRVLRVA